MLERATILVEVVERGDEQKKYIFIFTEREREKEKIG